MTDYRNDSGPDHEAGGDQPSARIIPGMTGASSSSADRVRAKADEIASRAAGLVERTLGEPAARKVRNRAEQAIDRADDAFVAGRSRLDHELIERPYRTLGLVAGAGVLFGLWLARR